MSESAPLGITAAKFAENQTILCYQGPLIYEAKVLEVTFKEDNGSYLYLVHYAGWKKRFREWVTEDRCLEHTSENLEKQANTFEEVQNQNLTKKIKLKNKTKKVKHEAQSNTSESFQSLQPQKEKSSSSDDKFDVAHENALANSAKPIKKRGSKRKKEKSPSSDEKSAVAHANNPESLPDLQIKNRGRKRKTEKSLSSDDQSDVTNGNVTDNLSVKRARTKEKLPDEESEKRSAEITIEKKVDSPIKKQEVKEEQQSGEENQNKLKNEEQQQHDQCQQNTLKQLVNSKKQQIQEKIEKQGQAIVIPRLLKSLHTDDYELINKMQMLFKIPATITVEKIIHRYTTEKELHKEDHDELKAVDMEGLKQIFNMKLGSSLLYKFERPQFGDVIKSYPDLTPCQIYGLPHLVRLLTLMELCFKKHSESDENMKRSRMICNDLIRYITKNFNHLVTISDDYNDASAEYCRRAAM